MSALRSNSIPSGGVRATPGGIPLFTLFGIRVTLHWMWLLVAFYQIQRGARDYGNIAWNIAEYLTLFLIVLIHEFGHALACRSVGGRAEHIMLWPLGGVAFVQPPQRPGAVLWSIAAGPLVNVALLPVTILAAWYVNDGSNFDRYLTVIAFINAGLLIFNMMPVYPLDGGQILRALLWFFMSAARSLKVASILGIAGAVLLFGGLAFITPADGRVWLAVMAFFVISQAWTGLSQARLLSRLESLPRHVGFQCPACRQSPPSVQMWVCPNCRNPADIFANSGACPHCGERFPNVPCPFCGLSNRFNLWLRPHGFPLEPPAIPSAAQGPGNSDTA